MSIGTSMGAYYDDAFHQAAAQWDPKYDDNEITPDQMGQNQQMDAVEMQQLGGLQVADKFTTPLSPEEQDKYGKKYSPQDSTDYDMQGFFKANPDVDPHTDGTHYPDTYKKPNHPTFSDESQYNGVDGNEGGTWGTTSEGSDTFTPGPTNIKTHGIGGLIDYFEKTEPNAQLLMPKTK